MTKWTSEPCFARSGTSRSRLHECFAFAKYPKRRNKRTGLHTKNASVSQRETMKFNRTATNFIDDAIENTCSRTIDTFFYDTAWTLGSLFRGEHRLLYRSTKPRVHQKEIGVSFSSSLFFFLTADRRSHVCRGWMFQEGKDNKEEHPLITPGSENRRQRGERRPAGASRRRMHFWLQRGARCGRRCTGADEELIRAFLASPFSLPQRRATFPPLLPIYFPSVVPLFPLFSLYFFLSIRNFSIFLSIH